MKPEEQNERWHCETLVAKSIFWGVMVIVSLLLGWLGFLKPSQSLPGDWFSKSGAFATVAALWANRAESEFIARYGHTGVADVVIYKIAPEAKKMAPWLDRFNFFLAVVSALVWGYGDVVYNWLMEA